MEAPIMDTAVTIKSLEEIKHQLNCWVKEIDAAITTLTLISSFQLTPLINTHKTKKPSIVNNENEVALENYKKEESLKAKVIYILTALNRFLHVSEMAGIMHQYEPDTDIREISAKLSPIFSSLQKDGIVVKICPTSKNKQVFWGFDHWLDESGSIKQKHRYKSVIPRTKKRNKLV